MKDFFSRFIPLKDTSFVNGTAAVFIGSMGVNFFSYLYHFAVGRLLGPADYGELAALLSIFYILNVPSNILQTILVKYFSIYKAQGELSQSKALLFFSAKRLMVLLLIVLVLLIPLLPSLSAFLHIRNQWYFLWLYLTVAFYLLATINLSAIQGYQLFVWSSSLMVIGTIVRLGIGIVCAMYGVGWSLVGNMLTNVFGFVTYALPLGFIVKAKTEKLTLSAKHAMSYSVPSMLATLGITSIYSTDVVLVKHFLSAPDAGLYSSLSVLGKVVFFASAAIGFVVFPILAERKELGKKYGQIVFLALAGVGTASLGLSLLYYLFPYFFVRMLFGQAFDSAAQYLGMFGLFISFFSLSSILTNICLAVTKTKVWIATSIAAVAQIVLLWQYHDGIGQIIVNNTVVSFSLFLVLLLYYVYETR